MLHLEREGADALEFAFGGREAVLVFRHGVGGGDEFAFRLAIFIVEDGGKAGSGFGGRFGFRFRRRLRRGKCRQQQANGTDLHGSVHGFFLLKR